MPFERTFIPRGQAQPPFFVGVDLGGTNVKAGVIDDLGRILSWRTIKTQVPDGAEIATQRMAQLVQAVIGDAGLTAGEICRVGLGSPGTMDIPTGMLLVPVNLTGWNYFPIRDRLSHYCGLPVTFANDARAAAYGEFWIGAGKAYPSMVLLTLGTGIGGGIILDDLILDGEHSHGSECGHMVIDFSPTARPCNCGKRGHLEPYASANGVIARTREALAAGRSSSVAARLAAGEELTPKLVSEEAAHGDEAARSVVFDTALYLGVGIATVCNIIDPAAVVLGGAMTFGGVETELGREFLARTAAEFRARALEPVGAHVEVRFASLGGDAGFIGAAGRARLEHRKLHHEGK